MLTNRHKLNGDKTGFLQFVPNTVSTKKLTLNQTLHIGSDNVILSLQAKNVGVIFDSDLSLFAHITSICKATNYHLYRLSCTKKYLTPKGLETARHAISLI